MITLHTFGPAFGHPDPSPFVMKAEVLLKMAGVAYKAVPSDVRRAPKGKLPYLTDNGRTVSDSTLIRFHIEAHHGADFDAGLDEMQKAIGWAAEKMLEDHLYWAVLESRWMIQANFDKGPKKFFASLPAPVRPFVTAMVRRSIARNLKAHGMGRHNRADIERLGIRSIDALATILADKPWLLGSEPSAVDASAWAFTLAGLCPVFDGPLRDAMQRHGNLVAYADRGLARWFPDFASQSAAGSTSA